MITKVHVKFSEKLIKKGYTPLHYSVIWSNLAAAKLLLDYGADPFILAQDGPYHGYTAHTIAAKQVFFIHNKFLTPKEKKMLVMLFEPVPIITEDKAKSAPLILGKSVYKQILQDW